jgi:Gram-negative bacterial TonB protein C-terminal
MRRRATCTRPARDRRDTPLRPSRARSRVTESFAEWHALVVADVFASAQNQRMTRTSSLRALSLSTLTALTLAVLGATPAEARSSAALRIDGDEQISPDALTAREILRAERTNVVGVFQVCIDSKGDVADIAVVKSTSFRAYDTKIQRQIRTWKYQPVLLGGQPAPVCTMVTLIYQQKL